MVVLLLVRAEVFFFVLGVCGLTPDPVYVRGGVSSGDARGPRLRAKTRTEQKWVTKKTPL